MRRTIVRSETWRVARALRRAALLSGFAIAALALAISGGPAEAQAPYAQTVELRPGWNAVYLEVQPDPAQIEDVFGPANCGVPAVPLLSVWTYDTRFGTVGSIIDPGRSLFTTTGWFGFFPASRPESVLSSLFALTPNTAYLVKLGGTQPVTCAVPGIPVLREREWVPDSFNLVGLGVDPSNPPTFESYFAPSAAHAGQPVFRLDPGGSWQPVLPFVETIRAGEAYWVYTQGQSSYQGPLEIALETGGDRLDFGGVLPNLRMEFDNRLDVDVTLAFERLPAPVPLPLFYRGFNDETGLAVWPELPQGFSLPVDADGSARLTIAPDRTAFVDRAEQVLSVSTEFGARVLLFMGDNTATSDTLGPTVPGGSRSFSNRGVGGGSSTFARRATGATATPAVAPAPPLAGLWLGRVEVDGVSEILCVPQDRNCVCRDPGTCSVDDEPCVLDTDCGPVSDVCAGGACTASAEACSTDADCPGTSQVCVEALVDPGDALECDPDCAGGQVCTCEPRRCVDETRASSPQPVGEPFTVRVIVHVDRNGDARLLKEVIQLFKQPLMGPDPATPGFQTIIDPGSFVLLTDEDLIPEFGGVALRDGKPVGLRVSTAAYDFDESTPGWEAETRAMPMVGSFSEDGLVTTVIEMGKNFPTNPFRHKFHPDHNNLDNQFLPMTDVCGETEFSCASDEDCRLPIEGGVAECLSSGQVCDPLNGDDDCFWPVPQGSTNVCLQSGAVCTAPADCGADGPCTAGSGVCDGTLDPCSNDANCPGGSCVQVVTTGRCREADSGFMICSANGETCSADADCQATICDGNGAACTGDASCLEVNILAGPAVCDGDPVLECSSDGDCGADGPCVPLRVCELDRSVQCGDDVDCVQLPATSGPANHRVCDGNVLRECDLDADCSGVDDLGVAFDDGLCADVRDEGPCLPVIDHGPCVDEYADVAAENPCVPGADLGACEERSEAPAIRRTIKLDFTSALDSFCTQGCDGPDDTADPDPPGCICQPPGWGSDEIGGTYEEIVVGLHRVPIVSRGEFTLRRVATAPVLNREP